MNPICGFKTAMIVYLTVFLMHFLGACSQCSKGPDVPETEQQRLVATIASPAEPQTLFENTTLHFQGTATGGTQPYSYEWDFAGSSQTSFIEDPGEVTFSIPGQYTVTFTVKDGSGNIDSASLLIEVVADTSPRARIDQPENGTVITEGESISFSASISGGNPPLSYQWDFGNKIEPSDQEDPGTIRFDEAGAYPVSFTVSDADGDKDSASATITVTKNIPSATIISPKENMTIFQGESILFQCLVKGGNPLFRYTWDFGGGATGTDKKNPGRVIFRNPGVYSVVFTIEDANRDKASDSKTITVIEDTKPVARITSPEADMVILEGKPIAFSGLAQGGNHPLALNWDFSGAAMKFSGQDPGDVIFSGPGTYSVRFTVQDASGDTVSDSRTITVIKDTVPVLSIISPAEDIVITEKGSVVFQAAVKEGNEPLTYLWDFDGARENLPDKDPGEVLLSTIGSFQVKCIVTDSDGDTGSDSITVNVVRDTRPRARVDLPEKNLRIYEGETAVFEGSVRDGNIPLKYTWDFGGGAKKSTAEDPGAVIFNKAGSYTAVFSVEDSDGDKDSDSVSITVIKSTWSLVAGGWSHSVGLKTDGSIWAWGWNLQGQLGNGLNSGSNKPILIGHERDWKRFSTGSAHTLAIKADGSLWAWGSNAAGQLGIGAAQQRSSPMRVGNDNTWSQIAAGSHHSVAVKTDGSLWVWGRNTEGQLGDGSLSYSTTPVRIGTEASWKDVAAGEAHTLAVKTDGSLWSWGSNELGQLGDGTQTDSPMPKHIAPGTAWVSIAAGKRHSLAVRNDGTLWAWGANLWGQLGDGTKVFKSEPFQVGRGKNWVNVSAGEYHSVALKTDGSIWGWGWNAFGQLGIDSFKDIHIPTRIGYDDDWNMITAGLHHTLAVKKNGTLWVWGYNGYGQLGDKTNEDTSRPVLIR